MPVTLNGNKPKPAAPKGTASATPKAAPSGSFLMKGKAAFSAFENEHATRAAQQEKNNKPFRFFFKQDQLGQETQLTFLDGDLDDENELILNSWSEHFVNLGDRWDSFVCLSPHYCPLCADDQPSVVAAFTVIDHSTYVVEKGKNAGKEYKDQKRLFVAKYQTVKQLSKFAQMHQGLRGLRLTACRTTKNAPSVGDLFQAEAKYDQNELHELYGKDKSGGWVSDPFDYEKVAPLYTLEQLKDLGIGSKNTVVGASNNADDVEKHL